MLKFSVSIFYIFLKFSYLYRKFQNTNKKYQKFPIILHEPQNLNDKNIQHSDSYPIEDRQFDDSAQASNHADKKKIHFKQPDTAGTIQQTSKLQNSQLN